MKKRTERSPNLQTAQEFINVEDIADGLLYSTDGYLFGYLSLRAGDNKLLSEEERGITASNMANALSTETEPWQLLSVPRTVDTQGMISHLTDLRRSAPEDARIHLINGEIDALQNMAREGTKEPFIVLKCWQKAARNADVELKKRLHDLRSTLTDCHVTAEFLEDRDIVYLCKVFADLGTYQEADEAAEDDVPGLPHGKRWFLKRDSGQADNADLLNLITPIGGISFGLSTVTVGGVMGRIYGALRYASELDYGWAIDLMNSSDCVTSMTYYPGNMAVLGDALSKSIRRNEREAYSESDARRRKRFERQAENADQLIEQLDFKNAAIGHVVLLTMPFSEKEADFDDVCRAVVSRYARKRIKLKSLGSVQKEAYKHLSPYYINQPTIDDMLRHIMPLETLLGGSPMTVNVYRDDQGCYFARTMDGGIVSLDLLYRGRDRTNGNITVTGESGQGKSTAMKHILETFNMIGVKCIVIDPEREYRDLCRNLGGAWLDAGGGVAKVNPLQFHPVPQDEPDEHGDRLYNADDNAMALHIHTLDVFFKLYLPSLNDLQRALLKKALIQVYESHGITWTTDVAQIAPNAFPVFYDLYTYMNQAMRSDSRYEDLTALLYDMSEGADSFLWNGPTNVQVDQNFVVFDTNRLINSSDEVKRAQYFNVLTMCWDMMSSVRDEPVFLLCDEAHILLDPAIPQTAMYLRNIAKRGRKYEGALGIGMQSIADALDPQIKLYGQAILDNSTYKLLFGCDGKNLDETVSAFHLTEAERDTLRAKQRGRALLLIGAQHLQVDFDIPQYKLDLMGMGGGR